MKTKSSSRKAFASEKAVALKAARVGAAILSKYFEKKISIKKKGRINLVTEVDERAQKAIIREIKKSFPKDAILAEEGDFARTAASARRWIIDPLDGTTNFAHGFPCFCVSIAFEAEGIVQVGVIHNPMLQEVFVAVKGQGAFLLRPRIKPRRLEVSGEKSLENCLLVSGFPYDLQNSKTNNLPVFCHMLFYSRAVRRDGSAALNLAYTAAGRFDGFWELGVSPWDVAAGILMIREAGGEVRNLDSHSHSIEYPQKFAAASPEILKQLLKEIERAQTPGAELEWKKLLR
jgi:myo-inositol-1(or 4)-monophosphatase